MTTQATNHPQEMMQTPETTAIPTHEEAVVKLYELIKGIKIAVLTTIDKADGSLHSRPMGTLEVEFDGALWFFTDVMSAKVDEIEHHNQVNVSYTDPHGHRYVSVSGAATLINDRTKMKAYWHPFLEMWFPDGLDTPTLGLLRVAPHRAEYWETDGRVKAFLKMAKALVMRHEVAKEHMGENEQLEF